MKYSNYILDYTFIDKSRSALKEERQAAVDNFIEREKFSGSIA
jgi:hypothetical protein